MRIPYEKITTSDGYGLCTYYKKLYLTGKSKTITGGPYEERHYLQVYRKLFGFNIGTRWVNIKNIEYFEEEKTIISDIPNQ